MSTHADVHVDNHKHGYKKIHAQDGASFSGVCDTARNFLRTFPPVGPKTED